MPNAQYIVYSLLFFTVYFNIKMCSRVSKSVRNIKHRLSVYSLLCLLYSLLSCP